MLGVVLTALVCLGWAGLAGALFARLFGDHDPAFRFGLSGLLGLGVLGWSTFPVGLLPGGLGWGIALPAIGALVGFGLMIKKPETRPWPIARPRGLGLGVSGAAALMALASLVSVLAPSDIQDWDSIAYHLAVPKIWLAAGRITFIEFIHHSNFPFAIDNLYIWGLVWGDQAGAKAFTWMISIFGTVALFGFVRGRYGESAGWWTVLAFAAVPVVAWQSGTAYIDVAHGLFVGLGLLLAVRWVEKRAPGDLWLAGICLGFGLASKYTGLQMLAATLAAVLVVGRRQRPFGEIVKAGALIAVVAGAIASPWYVRNVVNTGNPVYPFFYRVFGGKNWDRFRAEIYTEEQKTFGVGIREGRRLDWSALPHAVWGMAYQPGRYANPMQTQGGGAPTASIGFVAIAALSGLALGRRGVQERGILVGVAVAFVLWFFLSQQSRYAMNMATPLVAMVGGLIVGNRFGPVLAAAVGAQFLYTLWMTHLVNVEPRLAVALGRVTPAEHLRERLPFFEPAQVINEVAQGGKVALFDEVFGFYLDVPYFWANPGHGTMIPYESIETGEQLAEVFRAKGFTHIYVNLGATSGEDARRWLSAAGLGDENRPYTPEERQALVGDLRSKWRYLVAEASRGGFIRPVAGFRRSVLFALDRPR
ncbi:MAG: glycosyltransferase family 39 protein [Fimbriimonadaceae bacterium]